MFAFPYLCGRDLAVVILNSTLFGPLSHSQSCLNMKQWLAKVFIHAGSFILFLNTTADMNVFCLDLNNELLKLQSKVYVFISFEVKNNLRKTA